MNMKDGKYYFFEQPVLKLTRPMTSENIFIYMKSLTMLSIESWQKTIKTFDENCHYAICYEMDGYTLKFYFYIPDKNEQLIMKMML